ncbi:MAG TPA: heme o synthase [Candidatus Binatia bacterium]|jgi:protoheme IX farnesyltransferase|nr:heme o synthase [Candidatus Binatia bacterium]
MSITLDTLRIKTGDGRSALHHLAVLFKLRIVALLLLAALAGAFVGARGRPQWTDLLTVLLTGGMAAAGASALNQYLEREDDGRMGRTRRRPLVTGAFGGAGWVPWLGTALVLLPSLAVLHQNPALALFLMLGALIYVGVYTIWLKPRTLLNIVVGGAAGSAAVLSGAAAVGAWRQPGPLVLALLLFLWTPSHFWSLAILCREDYRRAEVPMLPAVSGARTAAAWVLLHSVSTGLAGLLLALAPGISRIYLVVALPLTAYLLRHNLRLLSRPTARRARSMFLASNIYLMVLLLALLLASIIPW